MTILLASCAQPERQPAPSPVSIPPAAPALPQPTDEQLLDARLDRFCADVGRIIHAEAKGFENLRNGAIGQRSWHATLVPDGLVDCKIDGPGRPLAIYECRSQPLSGRHEGLLEGTFAKAAGDLDHCLSQAIWYPKEWRRGELIEFGRGEKQLSWRDITVSPRPVVSLHIEEDFAQRIHYLRLAVSTLN